MWEWVRRIGGWIGLVAVSSEALRMLPQGGELEIELPDGQKVHSIASVGGRKVDVVGIRVRVR